MITNEHMVTKVVLKLTLFSNIYIFCYCYLFFTGSKKGVRQKDCQTIIGLFRTHITRKYESWDKTLLI